MIYKNFKVIVLSFVLLIGCASGTEGWNKYKNAENGFTIKYPKDWKIGMGTVRTVVLFEETVLENNNSLLTIKTNVDLAIERQKHKTIAQAASEYESNLINNQVFKNAQIISKSDTTFNNLEAVSMIGKANVIGYDLKWKIILFHHNNNYFELSGTTTEQRFDNMYPTINMIMSTLKFK